MVEEVKILLIENDPRDVALFDQLMRPNRFRSFPEMSYTIKKVTSMSEAVEAIEEGGIGVVVVDLLLADTSPNDILALIEKTSRKMPTVALTTEGAIDVAVDAIKHGAQDYLVKGSSSGDAIDRAIRYAIERKKLIEEQVVIKEELRRSNDELQAYSSRLEESERELSMLNQVLRTVSSEGSEGMYYDVLRTALEATESKFGIFAYIDEEGAAVAPTMTRGIWEKCHIPNKTMRFPRETWGDNVWSRAILQKRTQIKNEPGLVPEGHLPITRVMVVPIIHRDEVIGHFELANKETDYGEGDRHIIEAVAEQLSPLLAERLKRERSERMRQEAIDNLARSNEELQQFAYVASHDLQEPLRMVTAYLGLLEKKHSNELSPQAKEYMRTAFEGSVRMREFIDDLLRYSRIDSQSIVMEKVDMNEEVKTIEEDLHVVINDAGAEVIVNPLPSVCADRTQIKQLMMNLISNAIKFRGEATPRIEVSAIACGNDFVFSVKDNGIGIDPKYADKLFKMFQRLHTRDEYPGTGIGLAIAKKIVERHGGRIWFESEPGRGTTFYFSLPSGRPGDYSRQPNTSGS